jgi:hypothetical protein
MLNQLSLFFGSVSSWLTILKYLGLTLAAGSSVWATANTLIAPSEKGRNRLTFAGYISIALTVIGLVISIVSEDLQQLDAARTQAAQLKAEAERTNNIIIAGQPLTSLSVAWTIAGLDAELVQTLKQGNGAATAFLYDNPQGERGYQQDGALFREDQLYPFLVALCRRLSADMAKDGNANVIVLLPLDDGQNAVLPFGFLDHSKEWAMPSKSDDAKTPAAPSVEMGSHAYLGNSDLLNWPNIEPNGTTATLVWKLDPATFAKSLSRQNGFVIPTAKLPTILRVAVLFDIKRLPFTENNFALAENPNFWRLPRDPDSQQTNFRGRISPITPTFSSSIQLVPNGSSLVRYNYTLSGVYETQFLDEYGEFDSDVRCVIFEFKQQN